MHLYHSVLEIKTSNLKVVDELIVLIELTNELKFFPIDADTANYSFNIITMLL
jgi:hypothetical protein